MRDLIKNILKEYKEPFTITYYCDYSDIINEAIYPSKKEIQDLGYEPEPISDEEESLIKNYLNLINDDLIGTYTTKTGKKNNIKFKIELTRHWYFRLYRTKDPKSKKYPKIVDPSSFEVIDNIKKNIDRLTKFIVLRYPNENIVWEVNSPDNLNYLVKFVPTNIDGTEYKIIVINQIKGMDFFDTISKNKIPLR